MFCSLLVRSVRSACFDGLKAEIGIDLLHHFPRAQIAGEKHQALLEIDGGVVAQPQNAFVQDAQQQPRHRRRGLLDFVEQHQRQAALFAGHRIQLLLRQHRLRFAMAQISGRRADQLGDLVLHLELAAIDLENVLLAAVQDFGQRFDGLGLARSGGAQQQKHAHRAAFRSETRLEHLNVGNDDLGRGRLSHDLLRQNGGQILERIRRPAFVAGSVSALGFSTPLSALIIAAVTFLTRGRGASLQDGSALSLMTLLPIQFSNLPGNRCEAQTYF